MGSVVGYQFAMLTPRPAAQVISEVAALSVAGVAVDEEGPSYVVLKPWNRFAGLRYTSDIAAAVAIGIVLIALVLAAANVLFILLLLLAPLPAVPLLAGHHTVLAVSALDADDGLTRITVHGQATPALSAAIDAYINALPAAPAEEPITTGSPT